jgi:hypothetical protein
MFFDEKRAKSVTCSLLAGTLIYLQVQGSAAEYIADKGCGPVKEQPTEEDHAPRVPEVPPRAHVVQYGTVLNTTATSHSQWLGISRYLDKE